MRVRDLLSIFKEAFWQWYGDNTFRLGAALAYYTVFSLAPIVLIVIAIASLFVGESAHGEIVEQIGSTAGSRVGQAVQDILKYNREQGSGTLATIISVVVLVVGATTLFGQLQGALNTIWGVEPKAGRGVWGVIRDRLLSFGMVLVIAFLLLVSLVVSAAIASVLGSLPTDRLPGGGYIAQAVNWVVSVGVITVLFALIYKYLPDVEVRWSDVWVGALATAIFFSIGKLLIGLYLGQSSWINAYGAAGSLIVILLWVYYSSQILLYGAEFTQVYARHAGHPLTPAENAVPVTEESRARQGMSRRTPREREAVGHGAAGDGHVS
jgi:membrane protein